MLLDLSFKDYCALDGINASSLKHYAAEPFSPKTATYNFNKPSEDKPAFRIGRAVHSFLEHKNNQPDNMRTCPVELCKQYVSEEYPGEHDKEVKKIVKELKDNAKIRKEKMLKDGAELFKPSELTNISNMSNAIWTDPIMNDMLVSDSLLRECTIQVDMLKGMFDVIDPDNATIIDYKTTKHSDPRKIQADAYNYGYHLQAYHYSLLAERHFGHPFDFAFAFVCTAAPHETFLYICSQEFIDAGKKVWDISMERLAEFGDKVYSDLPGYSTEVLELDIPEWAEEEINDNDLEDFE